MLTAFDVRQRMSVNRILQPQQQEQQQQPSTRRAPFKRKWVAYVNENPDPPKPNHDPFNLPPFELKNSVTVLRCELWTVNARLALHHRYPMNFQPSEEIRSLPKTVEEFVVRRESSWEDLPKALLYRIKSLWAQGKTVLRIERCKLYVEDPIFEVKETMVYNIGSLWLCHPGRVIYWLNERVVSDEILVAIYVRLRRPWDFERMLMRAKRLKQS
jgi:hypothetical protein